MGYHNKGDFDLPRVTMLPLNNTEPDEGGIIIYLLGCIQEKVVGAQACILYVLYVCVYMTMPQKVFIIYNTGAGARGRREVSRP